MFYIFKYIKIQWNLLKCFRSNNFYNFISFLTFISGIYYARIFEKKIRRSKNSSLSSGASFSSLCVHKNISKYSCTINMYIYVHVLQVIHWPGLHLISPLVTSEMSINCEADTHESIAASEKNLIISRS